MTIRCKFRCESVTPQTTPYEGEIVKLRALYDPDNKDDQGYSKYTPSGTMEFHVTNENVIGQFKKDEAYYLTLTPVKEG